MNIQIEQKFLLEQDNTDLTKSSPVADALNKFMKFKTPMFKTLSIKSAYGSGKTHYLKSILSKYPAKTKRVLYVSYRCSLADDFNKNMSNFNFVDYRQDVKNLTKCNRVIVQLESINKLFVETDDGFEVPQYDLIILDEVESLLRHLQSSTFQGLAKQKFQFLCHIIEESKRMICLDGDLSDRAMDFINEFGQSINIVNSIKINQKKFYIKKNRAEYTKMIHFDLQDNKKIVICSLSAKECKFYNEYIKEQFPDLNIGCYYSKTNDEELQDLKNVNVWAEKDVVIYSPKVESGVDFSVKDHFHSLYAIICPKSSTSNAFLQMCSRVRNFQTNDIYILNENIKPVFNAELYDYEDIEDGLYKDIDLNCDIVRSEKNGRIYYNLSPNIYNKIFIHNKLETINNNSYFFTCLFNTCQKKGHTLIDLDEEKEKVNDNSISHIQELIQAEDITQEIFDTILRLQETGKASRVQKLQIERYMLKHLLGINTLNSSDDTQIQKLKQNVTKTRMDNYAIVSNFNNLPKQKNIDDNDKKLKIRKLNIVRDILQTLQLHVYEDESFYSASELQPNMTELYEHEIFSSLKDSKILFNVDKKNHLDPKATLKKSVSYVNVILQEYCIQIQTKQFKVKGKKVPKYYLRRMYNVDEILEHKDWIVSQEYKRAKNFKANHPLMYANLYKKEKQTNNNDEEYIDMMMCDDEEYECLVKDDECDYDEACDELDDLI